MEKRISMFPRFHLKENEIEVADEQYREEINADKLWIIFRRLEKDWCYDDRQETFEEQIDEYWDRLFPECWFSYQTILLLQRMSGLGKKEDVSKSVDVDRLWKIVSSKWLGQILTLFAIDTLSEDQGRRLNKEFFSEYNKHIRYIFRDGTIEDSEDNQSILSKLKSNFDRMQYWKSESITDIMLGYSDSTSKVPNWDKMFEKEIVNALNRQRCISMTKTNDGIYYYSISGMDHDRCGTSNKHCQNIENIAKTSNGTTPIRCFLEDDVLYTTSDHYDLTFSKFKHYNYNKNWNRMFTCSERKIYPRVGNLCLTIVSGWEPCFMCKTVKDDHYSQISLIGLSPWKDKPGEQDVWNRRAKTL